jgi:ubiquinone/menaquinone biosynthesis C-methylase UbiE
MGLYERHLLPRLIHLAMRAKRLEPYRARVAGAAQGRVLEVGIGSGLNLPFYSDRVTGLLGLEPHPGLRALETKAGRVEMLGGSAEAIPLAADSIDTVVSTWTLCSIANVSAALGEMRRVLRPGGRLLFAEHGLAPESSVQRMQQRWTPLWGKFTGGCHLDRRIDQLIHDAGFEIEELRCGYMEGPRALTFIYQGSARPVLSRCVTQRLG